MILWIIVSIVTVLLILYFSFPLIQVIGDSMYDTYKNGEIIIGTRVYRKSKLKSGDVIVYRCPVEKDRIVIKRISVVDKDLRFWCLGDNLEHSYDSRNYGSVPLKNVVCKVLKQRPKKSRDNIEFKDMEV